MHLFLYQANTDLLLRQSKLEELIESLPSFLRERARRYQSEQAAINFAYGRIILRSALGDLIQDDSLEKVRIAENGTPIHDEVYFNISHSDVQVVCGLSLEGELGLDIEEVIPRDFEPFTAFFTAAEWDLINSSADKFLAFTRLWTRKESIIKAVGHTLKELNDIALDPAIDEYELKGKTWYLRELEVAEKYCCTVCSEFPVETIEHVSL